MEWGSEVPQRCVYFEKDGRVQEKGTGLKSATGFRDFGSAKRNDWSAGALLKGGKVGFLLGLGGRPFRAKSDGGRECWGAQIVALCTHF